MRFITWWLKKHEDTFVVLGAFLLAIGPGLAATAVLFLLTNEPLTAFVILPIFFIEVGIYRVREEWREYKEEQK